MQENYQPVVLRKILLSKGATREEIEEELRKYNPESQSQSMTDTVLTVLRERNNMIRKENEKFVINSSHELSSVDIQELVDACNDRIEEFESKIAICWPTDKDEDKIEDFAKTINENGKVLWGVNWGLSQVKKTDYPITGYIYYRQNIIGISKISDCTSHDETSEHDLKLRPERWGDSGNYSHYLHITNIHRCEPFPHRKLELMDSSKTIPDVIQQRVYVKELREKNNFNCWIWSVTPENWEIVKEKNIWASKIGQNIRDRVRLGDKVIFYVQGTNEFQGIFEFAGEWYDAPEPVWSDETVSVIYPSQIKLKPIKIGSVKVYDVASELEMFPNPDDKRLINLVLKGGGGYPSNNGKPILYQDYRKLLELMSNSNEINYWKIAPGAQAENWPILLKNGIIAIGWKELDDLSNITQEELEKRIHEKLRASNPLHQITNFLKIKLGDIIIANKGMSTIVGIGRVVGNYIYDPTSEYPHTYPVDWFDTKTRKIPKQEEWGYTVVPVSSTQYDEFTSNDNFAEKQHYLLLRHSAKKENKWSDEIGKIYHFGKIPNYTKLVRGTKTIWHDREDGDFYYWGYGDIRKVENESEGQFKALFDNFTYFNEPTKENPKTEDVVPKKGSDSIKQKIMSLSGWNNQISVLPITKEIYDEIVNDKTIPNTLPEKIFDYDEQLHSLSQDEIQKGLQEIKSLLLIPDKKIVEIINALSSGSHVILAGPIGTGKTELARIIPKVFWFTDGGYYSDIYTATADWNTQDVIGGIVPKMNGNTVVYKIQDGCVAESVRKNWIGDKRKTTTIDRHAYRGVWAIIDEFNRADIDKAFGQLFTALRTRKMRLPTDSLDKTFDSMNIPKDFRIIGTLNTADKHYLFPLSDALKSRFAFIEIDIPERKFKDKEIFYALKNAIDYLEFKNVKDLTLDITNKVVQLNQSEIYSKIYEAYNFLDFVRQFHKLGTAILKIVYQNLLSGNNSKFDLNETLDNSINSVIIPQLEKLSEMELGSIKAIINNNLIGFLQEINKTNKRYNSSKTFSKILTYLNLNPKDYEYFTERELKADDKLWSEISKALTTIDSNKEKLPKNLHQTTKSLESLIEQSVI